MFVIKPNLRLKLAESQIEGGGSMHFPNLGTQNCRIWQHHSRIWKLSYNRSSEKGESQICEKFKYEKFKCQSPTLAQKKIVATHCSWTVQLSSAKLVDAWKYHQNNVPTRVRAVNMTFSIAVPLHPFFNQRSPMHVGSNTLECPEPRQRQ